MTGFLSLGSNLGNRKQKLDQALVFLKHTPGLRIIKTSSFYETEPWGGVEQDPFLNLVVEIEAVMDPSLLLQKCQEIEKKLGREKSSHWGPRSIDIDILTYNNNKVKTSELTIPHPYMEEREFVLAPLREIAPDYILPSGQSIQEVKGEGEVKKISFT